jgi:hypothetical protein
MENKKIAHHVEEMWMGWRFPREEVELPKQCLVMYHSYSSSEWDQRFRRAYMSGVRRGGGHNNFIVCRSVGTLAICGVVPFRFGQKRSFLSE